MICVLNEKGVLRYSAIRKEMLNVTEPFHKEAGRLEQLREVWAKIQTRKATRQFLKSFISMY